MHISSWLSDKLKTNENKNEVDELVLKRISGGNIVGYKPIFSLDGESIYVISKNSIREYNIKNGYLIKEYAPVEDQLIGILLSPEDTDTVIGCTYKGELVNWNCKNGFITKREKLVIPNVVIRTFNIISYKLNSGMSVKNVLITYVLEDIETNQLYLNIEIYDFKSGMKIMYKKIEIINEYYYIDIIANYGDNLIGVAHNRGLYIFDPTQRLKFLRHKTEREFSTICGHPEEECVATGDVSGRVLIWRNLLDLYPVKTTYHWHTLPARNIIFSQSGGYMYTGGSERVLVKWLLSNPQNKAFLPRLAAPIRYLAIAPENVHLAISTLDNGITIMNAQRQIVSTIQNFTLSFDDSVEQFPAGLVLDPLTNSLVLNSRTGHIQFFNTINKNLLYNLNITDQNIITDERDLKIVNTEVIKIAINCDGSWLATVEERDDAINHKDLRLKFWLYSKEKQNFFLNTVIEYPHEIGINSIKFKPKSSAEDEECAITIGRDRKFKLWTFSQQDSKDGDSHWKCYSHQSYRNLSTMDASFSIDGSVLAVGFENNLTLWNPELMEFKCNLTNIYLKEDSRRVEFGNQDQCHLIVVGYTSHLAVWSIDDLSVKWITQVNLLTLTSDPFSSYMAIVSDENKLIVFTPESEKPVYVKNSIAENDCSILSACFVPQQQNRENLLEWQTNSQLFYLTTEKELLVLEPKSDTNERLEKVSLNSSLPLTMFQRMICKKISNVEKHSSVIFEHNDSSAHNSIMELFLTTPSYKLPPMSSLCSPFLISLIKKYQSNKNRYMSPSEKNEKNIDYQINEESVSLNKTIEISKRENSYDNIKVLTDSNWDFLQGILPSFGDI